MVELDWLQCSFFFKASMYFYLEGWNVLGPPFLVHGLARYLDRLTSNIHHRLFLATLVSWAVLTTRPVGFKNECSSISSRAILHIIVYSRSIKTSSPENGKIKWKKNCKKLSYERAILKSPAGENNRRLASKSKWGAQIKHQPWWSPFSIWACQAAGGAASGSACCRPAPATPFSDPTSYAPPNGSAWTIHLHTHTHTNSGIHEYLAS